MSIYDKPVGSLAPSDLSALLANSSVENVRLEFKRDVPSKDEVLKKLSSLANTYGGYLVIGAEANSDDGRITGLPGIAPEAGIKQRLVQWLFDGTSPPVTAFVSDGIPCPQDASRVCYVVFVPASQQTPHFLNGRRGAYVRTDEFSQRFDSRLATFAEITHLANRRQFAADTIRRLYDRSQLRFQSLVDSDYAKQTNNAAGIGATMELFLVPSFPATPLAEPERLLRILKDVRLAWRSVGFPNSHSVLTQHESALVMQPAGGFSMLEASTWGHLFYANEMERMLQGNPGIHSHSFVAHLLVFLEHARNCYAALGFQGTIDAKLAVKRIRGLPWAYFSSGFTEFGPASPLDNQALIEMQFAPSRLESDLDGIASDFFRAVAYALNWPDVANNPDTIAGFLKRGYDYNGWLGKPAAPFRS